MKRVISDGKYIIVAQLIATLTQLAILSFTAHSVSVREFGEFTTANTIECLIESIFISRSGELALHYIGKHWTDGNHENAQQYGNHIRRMDWIINWLIYFIIITIAFSSSKTLNFNAWYLIILGLQIPAQIGFGVYKNLFIITSKIKKDAILSIFVSLLQFITSIVAIYYLGISGLIVSFVFVSLIKTLLYKWVSDKLWQEPKVRAKGATLGVVEVVKEEDNLDLKAWWVFNLHSILRNTFINASGQIDILLLSFFKGSEAVAVYKVAKTLASTPNKIASPIWSTLRPQLLQAYYKVEYSKLLKLIAIPSGFLVVVLLILIIPITLIGETIVLLIFGYQYIDAVVPSFILLIGLWLFSSVNGWFNFWIIISGHLKSGTLIYGALFLMITAACFILRNYSLEVVTIGIATSMLIASIGCWVIFLLSLTSAPVKN